MLEKQPFDLRYERGIGSAHRLRVESGHSAGERRPEMARLVGLFTLFMALFVAAGMFAL
jgi:hypothetical protein